ncbi:hypothetical protein I302_109087 [Kwoniella bestiolae CBS 10118]|uniref:Uncharacterized protein n=1 Tax=Kwoniella bestiolae CBS 10118 TaxID=1296100 RepID=A0A1B9FUY5_9TREE|nr:hypothetical protein I302_08232 [Kwoniella bestiolae CBS 10118]OCF22582.1 hypothetical protein I302_08232 [Kwoniella bestiolae CBS 10118]
MSVKFTPGPHPTSLSRSSSSHLPTPTPAPSQPNSPITVTFPKSPHKPSRLNPNADANADELERQPLISTGELNRPKYTWSIISGVAVMVLIGVFIGFGGWRLGQGAGGGRWPGSPGI